MIRDLFKVLIVALETPNHLHDHSSLLIEQVDLVEANNCLESHSHHVQVWPCASIVKELIILMYFVKENWSPNKKSLIMIGYVSGLVPDPLILDHSRGSPTAFLYFPLFFNTFHMF